jgi:hypothetical protein
LELWVGYMLREKGGFVKREIGGLVYIEMGLSSKRWVAKFSELASK